MYLGETVKLQVIPKSILNRIPLHLSNPNNKPSLLSTKEEREPFEMTLLTATFPRLSKEKNEQKKSDNRENPSINPTPPRSLTLFPHGTVLLLFLS